MKYDFFKDIEAKHGLCCAPVYSKLFDGVKFIPKTYCIIHDPSNNDTVLKVSIKDPNIKKLKEDINFSLVSLNNLNKYIIHNVYFEYDEAYFVISNIRVEDGKVYYDYEYYDTDSYYKVCDAKKTLVPKPVHFKELGIKPNSSDSEYVETKDDNDPITFLTYMHIKLKEWHSTINSARTRK